MTLFEYLAIGYSLVLSFAVVRCVAGLPHAMAPGRRYWVHMIWMCSTLGTILLAFWNFWFFRDVDWTLGKFALVLTNPTLLFIFTAFLVPDTPDHVGSWRDHYYQVRSKLFVVGMLWTALLILISSLVLDMPLKHPARIYHYGMLTIFSLGWLSRSPKVHAVITCVPLAVITLFLVLTFSQPEIKNRLQKTNAFLPGHSETVSPASH